jgi:hypothetical protein
MGVQALSKAYQATSIGDEVWVNCDPDETLDDFRIVVAAVEALQAVNHITILEMRQELWCGRAPYHRY